MSLMRYSHGMSIERDAPEIYQGYPYKRRLWPAWQKAWDMLRASGPEYQDGTLIARAAAEEAGLAPATMQAILTRAAAAGLLARESRVVPIQVKRKRRDGSTYAVSSSRVRSFYRIRERA